MPHSPSIGLLSFVFVIFVVPSTLQPVNAADPHSTGTVNGCVCRGSTECHSPTGQAHNGLHWCNTTRPCRHHDDVERYWDFCETAAQVLETLPDWCSRYHQRGEQAAHIGSGWVGSTLGRCISGQRLLNGLGGGGLVWKTMSDVAYSLLSCESRCKAKEMFNIKDGAALLVKWKGVLLLALSLMAYSIVYATWIDCVWTATNELEEAKCKSQQSGSRGTSRQTNKRARLSMSSEKLHQD